jgi:cell division septation protein DedD
MEEQQPQTHSRRSYIYDSRGGKSKKKLFAIIGGIVIVILVLIIGSMVFSGGKEEPEEDIFATPATQAPTNTPTPSPTPEEDEKGKTAEEKTTEDEAATEAELARAKFSILIQNGSGTAGAAGRLADILGDLGYKVAGTENADNFDYLETEINVASGNTTLLNLLKGDLEDEYTIGDTSTDYDGDADAVVIIGAE